MAKKKNQTSRGRHAAGVSSDKVKKNSATGADLPAKATDETTKIDQVISPAETKEASDTQTSASAEPIREGAFTPALNTPVRQIDMTNAKRHGRKHGAAKILAITAGVLLVLAIAAYSGVALYFTDRFMPQSKIGNLDVSLMTADEAQDAIEQSIAGYELSIVGDGFDLDLTASDAGLAIDAEAVVRAALSHENPWDWPNELQKPHDETGALVTTYNNSGLGDVIRAAVEEYNANATQPINATIGYDATTHSFVVRAEKPGTALNPDAVIRAADEAIIALSSQAKLTDADLLQPEVTSTDQRLADAASQANKMITANLVLDMDGIEVGEINADLLSQWITIDENLQATLDTEKLTEWVDNLVKDCSTVGTQRTYKRPDGKECTVDGGIYGWEVDGEALQTMVRDAVDGGAVQTISVPTLSEGDAYTAPGEQDWGKRYLDIDLTEQYVRLYDDKGELVWESDCVSGEPDGEHDTSTGVFWLNRKASPSKLIGYEGDKRIYETEVRYWMPFDGNAIGLHDADWQSEFGGERFKEGFGSHGCVNLPVDKAKELYDLIEEGDVVVSHW